MWTFDRGTAATATLIGSGRRREPLLPLHRCATYVGLISKCFRCIKRVKQEKQIKDAKKQQVVPVSSMINHLQEVHNHERKKRDMNEPPFLLFTLKFNAHSSSEESI